MVNLQSVMLRFAEPFMDARYSKASLPPLTTDRILTFKVQIDRIDPLYFARSSRIDVKEETRIKATSDEASAWVKENESPNGSFQFIFMSLKKHWFAWGAAPPNFISDIFYLTVAISHFGYLRTISNFEELGKHIEDLQRHLDMLNGDGSWMGVSPDHMPIYIGWLHALVDTCPSQDGGRY